MKIIKLKEILRILNINKQVDENIYITYVGDDIKKIRNNSLIFHIHKDEELNVETYKKLSHCYIVCDQPLLVDYKELKDKFFLVSNVNTFYLQFVKYYRSLFKIPVIAVTGTCGKTTTKEMIAQVLKQKHEVVHTISSKNNLRFNNDYLMSFSDKTEYAVFETAITHPGHLLYQCEFFQPTIGIITTIGIDHLNHCKTMDIYTRTKGEMLTGLGNKGILIINNDNKYIKRIDMSLFKGEIITFGFKDGADFKVTNINYLDLGMNYEFTYLGKVYKGYIPGFGEHNVLNAMAATIALYKIGYKIEDALIFLSRFKHIRSHTELKKGINNSLIIDDTWSSNPTSMKAALKVLSVKGEAKDKILVLGKINYLGKHKQDHYQKIAKMVKKYNVNTLITLDEDAKVIGKFALENGFNINNILHFQNDEKLISYFKENLNQNSIVLFKFSMLDKTHQKVIDEIIA